jgi:flagellar motor switch protein FliM
MTVAARNSLEGLFTGPQDLVERLPMLRTILQRTASKWAEEIAGISATTPGVMLSGVESGPAEAMLAAVANHAAASVLEAPNWNARLVVCADHAFVLAITEMLMGGDGSEPAAPADRPVTRVELGLATVVFEKFAGALEQAFAPLSHTNFLAGAADARANFEVLGRLTVPVVTARFRLSVFGQTGDITLTMSQSVLSPMRNELSTPAGPEKVRPDPAWSQKIQSEVTRASVELVAVLDEQELTLGEVAAFCVGQLLQLRASPDGVLCVECNGERLINCEIGKSNGVYTLRVRDFVDHEQEFIEDILGG